LAPIAAPSDPGPGCGNELQACRDAEPCMFIYDCAYASGCVFKKTQGESISCAAQIRLRRRHYGGYCADDVLS
jgi:hypothetical protein